MNNLLEGNISVPYDRILEEARLKIALARQHIETLKDLGLTPKELDDLEATANEAEQLPNYAYQQGQLRSLTQTKDKHLAEFVAWGRLLRTRMKFAYTDGTIPPTPFPTGPWNASQNNESKAIALIPTLIRVARDNKQALTSVGFKDSDIAAAQQLHDNLKAANEAQETYKLQSTSATQKRRQVFRTLYNGVSRINQIGQATYPPNTADGQLFRSNWRRTNSGSGSPAPDTDFTELDIPAGEIDTVEAVETV